LFLGCFLGFILRVFERIWSLRVQGIGFVSILILYIYL